MTDHIDCIVIGAGVVGLTCARAIARTGKEVLVLEATNLIGSGISSRNSEVIHAGIYYPKDSLKAKFCVEGRELLYKFCEDYGVSFKKTGKIIVATSQNQHAQLEEIATKAQNNGVTDLRPLSKDDLNKLEPALNGVSGLLSPSTGILDTHGYMLALQGDIEDHSGMIAFNSPVQKVEIKQDGFQVFVSGETPMQLNCDFLINCAGLNAIDIANKMDDLSKKEIPKAYFCKGNYFSLQGKAPFSHLIYPVPENAGLGVHLTLDLGGQARFGPDVEWLESGDDIDYRVDPTRGEKFYAAIRTYWPDLKDGQLQPDYSGVRPKIQSPEEAAKDFMIDDHHNHGYFGLVNLFGIESPGLTSSLAIAQNVCTRLDL